MGSQAQRERTEVMQALCDEMCIEVTAI